MEICIKIILLPRIGDIPFITQKSNTCDATVSWRYQTNTLSLVSPPPLIMMNKNEATGILQTNCDEQKTLCTHLTLT